MIERPIPTNQTGVQAPEVKKEPATGEMGPNIRSATERPGESLLEKVGIALGRMASLQ